MSNISSTWNVELPANMHHGIFEENQFHSRNEIIIGGHGLQEKFLESGPTMGGHVLWLSNAACKMAIDVRPFKYNALVDLLEGLFDNVLLHFTEALNVLVVDEFVGVNSLRFV